MTLPEVVAEVKPGDVIYRRENPLRLFYLDSFSPKNKGAKRLLIDYYGQSAALFNDDIVANDWEHW